MRSVRRSRHKFRGLLTIGICEVGKSSEAVDEVDIMNVSNNWQRWRPWDWFRHLVRFDSERPECEIECEIECNVSEDAIDAERHKQIYI